MCVHSKTRAPSHISHIRWPNVICGQRYHYWHSAVGPTWERQRVLPAYILFLNLTHIIKTIGPMLAYGWPTNEISPLAYSWHLVDPPMTFHHWPTVGTWLTHQWHSTIGLQLALSWPTNDIPPLAYCWHMVDPPMTFFHWPVVGTWLTLQWHSIIGIQLAHLWPTGVIHPLTHQIMGIFITLGYKCASVIYPQHREIPNITPTDHTTLNGLVQSQQWQNPLVHHWQNLLDTCSAGQCWFTRE